MTNTSIPTCIGAIYRIESDPICNLSRLYLLRVRIESDPNCIFSRLYSLRVRHKISKSQVWGKIQGRVIHSSDSYPVKRLESDSTPTLTDIHIRRTLPLDYGLNYGFWMRIEAGIEALPNTVKGIYPQL